MTQWFFVQISSVDPCWIPFFQAFARCGDAEVPLEGAPQRAPQSRAASYPVGLEDTESLLARQLDGSQWGVQASGAVEETAGPNFFCGNMSADFFSNMEI